MKYIGMPHLMWVMFNKSFRKQLVETFNESLSSSKEITKLAKIKYKEIIKDLPEFDKKDMFKKIAINCCLLISFLLSIDNIPSLDEVSLFYKRSMCTKTMQIFSKIKGKKIFKKKMIEQLQEVSKARYGDKNNYSWNFDLIIYPDNSGYERRFYKCGVCTLMRKYGLSAYTKALCRYDYDMAILCGTYTFIRKDALSNGAPFCDNGFKMNN